MSLIPFRASSGKFTDSSLDGMPNRLSGSTQDTRSLRGRNGYSCASSAAAHRLLYTHSLRAGSVESSPTSRVAQYPEVGQFPIPPPNSYPLTRPKVYVSRYSLSSKPHSWPTLKALENSLANIGSLAVGPIKACSHLYDSSSYIYAYISLHDVSYEAASRNYSDALEESGVAPLLTSSNSIDSCLDSITALLSFTTAMWVCLYAYSVPSSYFENRVHINALLAFAVWVGFQVSALCMIPLRVC